MARANNQVFDHLRTAALRISKLHFVYVSLFIVQTIIFHATKVITPELLLKRWSAAAGLLVVTTLAWFVSRNRHLLSLNYKLAIWAIILADIAFAAFNVYTQRGYASKSVLLFVIPVVVAAALVNRGALIVAAVLAIAVYTTTAISYFVLNFNEGYSAELYAEIGFYSGLFLLVAALLWATMRKRE